MRGLTNIGLTNIRCTIGCDIAFDACPRAVTNLSPTFITCASHGRRRISGHSCTARILRTSLVIRDRIRIIVLRNDYAITIANHDLAIASRLIGRWRICSDVRLDTRTLDTIHGDTLIRRRRAIRSHRANRTTSAAAHSPHTTAAHSAHSCGPAAARRGRRRRRRRRRTVATTRANLATIDSGHEFTTGRNGKESNDAEHRACQNSGVKCLHCFLDPLRNVRPESRVRRVESGSIERLIRELQQRERRST